MRHEIFPGKLSMITTLPGAEKTPVYSEGLLSTSDGQVRGLLVPQDGPVQGREGLLTGQGLGQNLLAEVTILY